jgi:hypothetical protein
MTMDIFYIIINSCPGPMAKIKLKKEEPFPALQIFKTNYFLNPPSTLPQSHILYSALYSYENINS